ncbi:hypothetical protein [Nocardia higoensis]|uniref:hypothetical protein n=1 Tax=Nocardia higoensis TaxID=228599 RepID=UPI0012F6D591|nr:hypothetical protein [Nocardia higoensis]
MNDPEGLTGEIGHLDPIEVLDPVRWRRPWPQWDPWAMYLAGHQEKTAHRLLAELRAVACETRKRIVNGNDVEDQYCHAAGLRDARATLN